MRTQGRDSGPHAQEGGFVRDQPCCTWMWEFSLQDWERINVCHLSPPACGTLPQQPKKQARGRAVHMKPLAGAPSPTGQTRFRVPRSRQSFGAGCANQLPAPQKDRREQWMDGRPLRSKQSAGAAEGQGLLWTVVVSSLCPLCLKCRTNTASANSGC